MFHFNILLVMTTLCLSLSSNALPVASTRQVDAENNDIARNVVPGIEPRFLKATTTAKHVQGAKPSLAKSSVIESVASSSSPVREATPTLLPSTPPTSNGTHLATVNNATQANVCALPALNTTPATAVSARSLSIRALVAINHLLGRDSAEFVGFHGTNSATASFWASQGGRISMPPGRSGILDFLGLASTGDGTSGAAAELGPGLYVADDPTIARAFANGNAVRNPGTTAKVCAIFAPSSGNWRNVVQKAFIPQQLIGDSGDPARAQRKESKRLSYIRNIGIPVTPTTVVKFSLLDNRSRIGQMLLPSLITNQFVARCFDSSIDPRRALPGLIPNLATFRYDSQTFRSAWLIRTENQAVANAIAACR